MKPCLLTVGCLIFAYQTTSPSRDVPASQSTGTAVVRGRVTAAVGGQPLHRVRLTLNGPLANPPTGVTDTRGEFEITNVPPGSYSISAARAGYLTVQYGQRQPQESGRTVELRVGQILERIDIALPRGAVLAGVISDDLGDAYPGVRVEALEFRYVRGRRMAVQAASATTNDLGQFRLSGLAPGSYLLRASTTDTWQSDDGNSTYTYATTYYPGVTGDDQAERVSVGAGEELSSLNFGLRVGRAATISGILKNAAGEAIASQAITLSRATRGVGGTLFSTQGAGSKRTDRNGSFEFAGLAPGEYLVNTGTDAERISIPVIVRAGDARHVALLPRKLATLMGSIVTDEGTAPPFPPARLRVNAISTDPDSLLPSFTGPGPVAVGREWGFRLINLDGQYLFRLEGLPAEWMLGAVLLDGRNIVDTPLSVRADSPQLKGLQVVLTRRGGTVAGKVVNPDGSASADATVIVFAADPSRWTVASRLVKTARPDNAGHFSIGGLPAGAYAAAAMDFVADGQWEDPAFLNNLTRTAVRFELAAAGSAALTLKLKSRR